VFGSGGVFFFRLQFAGHVGQNRGDLGPRLGGLELDVLRGQRGFEDAHAFRFGRERLGTTSWSTGLDAGQGRRHGLLT
jgi:hypothetical protein